MSANGMPALTRPFGDGEEADVKPEKMQAPPPPPVPLTVRRAKRVDKKLTTTVVGSFPKPDYLEIPDWFRTGTTNDRATDAFNAFTKSLGEGAASSLEPTIRRATKEVISFQRCECGPRGIDVATDGEVRRENYIHHFCRQLEGLDFNDLEIVSVRGGAYETSLPRVVGKVQMKNEFRDASEAVREWRTSQRIADEVNEKTGLPLQPIKYTLPGPITIMGTLHCGIPGLTTKRTNDHYTSECALAADLAAIVNLEAKALAAAGCQHIQVDEPVFCRRPEVALDWGVEMLNSCFEGVRECAVDASEAASPIERVVHLCCGYPDHCDQQGYLKASPENYMKLAPHLDAACNLDSFSIEDAHQQNDLSQLLPLFKSKKVILGCVQSACSRVESVDEIEARLKEALKYIDRDRLVVAPDCGLGLLTPAMIQGKLSNMCAAAARC